MRPNLLISAVILVGFSAPAPAADDTVVLRGKPAFQNVDVLGFYDNHVHFRGVSRQVLRKPLDEVARIELARSPTFTNAEHAASEGRFADAAAEYQRSLDELDEPWLRALAQRRRYQALRGSSDLAATMNAYLALVRADPRLAVPLAPRTPAPPGSPTNLHAREQIAESLSKPLAADARAVLWTLWVELCFYDDVPLPEPLAAQRRRKNPSKPPRAPTKPDEVPTSQPAQTAPAPHATQPAQLATDRAIQSETGSDAPPLLFGDQPSSPPPRDPANNDDDPPPLLFDEHAVRTETASPATDTDNQPPPLAFGDASASAPTQRARGAGISTNAGDAMAAGVPRLALLTLPPRTFALDRVARYLDEHNPASALRLLDRIKPHLREIDRDRATLLAARALLTDNPRPALTNLLTLATQTKDRGIEAQALYYAAVAHETLAEHEAAQAIYRALANRDDLPDPLRTRLTAQRKLPDNSRPRSSNEPGADND